VIEGRDAESIYQVPLLLENEGLSDLVVKLLNLRGGKPDLTDWAQFASGVVKPQNHVKIAITGKYVELHDAYKSIMESFVHAGEANNARVELTWVPSEEVEIDGPDQYLEKVSGLLIPGGFGERGIEGKILAVRYARENDLPFFGICLGLQCAVIEFARSVCGLETANSREFNQEPEHPVIDFMPGQYKGMDKGGTMRLGAYPCVLAKGSRALKIYGEDRISERHRHRFEVSNDYRERLEAKGLVLCGLSPDRQLVEMIELPEKRWFVATQFHPEFKSRALKPHPLFRSFVSAALDHQKEKRGK
jgi:CTP synthase